MSPCLVASSVAFCAVSLTSATVCWAVCFRLVTVEDNDDWALVVGAEIANGLLLFAATKGQTEKCGDGNAGEKFRFHNVIIWDWLRASYPECCSNAQGISRREA